MLDSNRKSLLLRMPVLPLRGMMVFPHMVLHFDVGREKSMKLTTEINHKARLLDVDEYEISGADMFYGFVAGVLAGNYDITELFIDGILKVVDHDMDQATKVLAEIDKITANNVEVVVTVSANEQDLPEGIKKYL